MIEKHDLAEKRASIYWWFSTLLICELNDRQIAALTGESGDTIFKALTEESLDSEVDEVRSALDRLGSEGELRYELAADYAQTFLRDSRHSALPYASVYLSEDGLLYQQPQQEMQALLQQEGLAVDGNLGEPADHIAVQLDYLGNLVLRGINTADEQQYHDRVDLQLAFIKEQLLPWVPKLVEKCQSIDGAQFYPAICSLLLAYLKAEQSHMETDDDQAV